MEYSDRHGIGCETRGMEWASSVELAEHFVQPWYLKMMRLNACEYGSQLAPEIARVASEANDEILVRLLRLGWRERVMGAWMSVTRDSEKVTSEVLRQLEGSHGSLDAPPLAAAAVTLAGAAALGSLAKYYERDVASQWGAADVIQEATQSLQDRFGVSNPLPPPPYGKHQVFDDLLAVATAIRGR
jgi:Family of unknown function (DUF6000)